MHKYVIMNRLFNMYFILFFVGTRDIDADQKIDNDLSIQ